MWRKKPFEDEIKARQGFYQVVEYNFSILAAIVKDNKDYDAELASKAANNILTLSTVDNSFHWPKGSDNSELDYIRAKK